MNIQISDYDENFDQLDPKVEEEALVDTYLKFGADTYDDELRLTDRAQEFYDERVNELRVEVL